MQYLIVIEKTETGYSVYAPDLPGCVSTGSTPKEARKNMEEAVAFHIDGLQLEGLAVPQSTPKEKIIRLKQRKSTTKQPLSTAKHMISVVKVKTGIASR